jgi:CPA1 family monovalent cation:H+ antiporter
VALILLLPADFQYQSLFLSLAFVMIMFSLLVYPLVTVRILSKMTN